MPATSSYARYFCPWCLRCHRCPRRRFSNGSMSLSISNAAYGCPYGPKNPGNTIAKCDPVAGRAVGACHLSMGARKCLCLLGTKPLFRVGRARFRIYRRPANHYRRILASKGSCCVFDNQFPYSRVRALLRCSSTIRFGRRDCAGSADSGPGMGICLYRPRPKTSRRHQ